MKRMNAMKKKNAVSVYEEKYIPNLKEPENKAGSTFEIRTSDFPKNVDYKYFTP